MQMVVLRQFLGMSQREFADYFGIPVVTLRNWEQGIAKPPEYVYQMITRCIRRDKMINIETIRFQKMLDDLAERSENGIEPFCNATEANRDEKIFYEESSGMIVLDACLIGDHHDICSRYEDGEYIMRVVFCDEEPYVSIKMVESDVEIVIEHGNWYFSN